MAVAETVERQVTAPTWAEAKAAEEAAAREHGHMTKMLEACHAALKVGRINVEQHKAAVTKYDEARTAHVAARHASDLALVREVIPIVEARLFRSDSNVIDPASVLAEIEKGAGG